jgi:hypothetical protein
MKGLYHNNGKPKGVTFDNQSQRYKARIRVKGKLYHVGSYPTERDALNAYLKALSLSLHTPTDLFAQTIKSAPDWGKEKYGLSWDVYKRRNT